MVWLIAVTFVVYYFSFQTGYSIVSASLEDELGLTIPQIGLIAALYTWVFAICQFLSGPLLDRIGSRNVLLPAIVLVTLGIFLFANADSFGALLLSQVFIALGACTGFVGAGYVGGSWFGAAKFGLMFGLVQFAASLFSAFNQNKTPNIPGEVLQVSADRLTDERTGEPYYQLKAKVTPEGMTLLTHHQVRAGMPVEIFVKTGERSLMNYLFRPILDRLHAAMSEE